MNPAKKSVAVTSAAAADFTLMERNSLTRTQNTLAELHENANMKVHKPTRVNGRLVIPKPKPAMDNPNAENAFPYKSSGRRPNESTR